MLKRIKRAGMAAVLIISLLSATMTGAAVGAAEQIDPSAETIPLFTEITVPENSGEKMYKFVACTSAFSIRDLWQNNRTDYTPGDAPIVMDSEGNNIETHGGGGSDHFYWSYSSEIGETYYVVCDDSPRSQTFMIRPGSAQTVPFRTDVAIPANSAQAVYEFVAPSASLAIRHIYEYRMLFELYDGYGDRVQADAYGYDETSGSDAYYYPTKPGEKYYLLAKADADSEYIFQVIPYRQEIMDDSDTLAESAGATLTKSASDDFLLPATHQAAVPDDYTGIYTSQDLNGIRNDLDGNYILMNDIDLSEYDNWQPIGTSVNDCFTGVIDGNGYAIDHLTITHEETFTNNISKKYYFGLFGSCKDATIKNLSLNHINISINLYTAEHAAATNTVYCGGIVGYAIGRTNPIAIADCEVNGDISVRSATTETLDGSSITTNTDPSHFVGGVVGRIEDGLISDTIHIGNVTSEGNGIRGDDVYVWTGGVIGSGSSCIVERCTNRGEIYSQAIGATAKSYAGGIAGELHRESSMITKCANVANIESLVSSNGSHYRSDSHAGGIVGLTGVSAFNISLCYNTGNIHATGGVMISSETYAAGIVGKGNARILNCYNQGNMTAHGYAAGILGSAYSSSSTTMTYCYSSGNMATTQETQNRTFCAGLVGEISSTASPNVTYSLWLDSAGADRAFASGSYQKQIDVPDGDTTIALTHEEMTQQDFFAGFDFAEIWMMPAEGGYPVFRTAEVIDNDEVIDIDGDYVFRGIADISEAPENAWIHKEYTDIPSGTANNAVALGLPEHPAVKVYVQPTGASGNDGIQLCTAHIKWDSSCPDYNPDDMSVQEFLYRGSVYLPENITVPVQEMDVIRMSMTVEAGILTYAKHIYNYIEKGGESTCSDYFTFMNELRLYQQNKFLNATESKDYEEDITDISAITIGFTILALTAKNPAEDMASYGIDIIERTIDEAVTLGNENIDSFDDFVYSQAEKGLNKAQVATLQQKHLMIKETGGVFSDPLKAAEYIEAYLNLKLGISSLNFGANYFSAQLDTTWDELFNSILEKTLKGFVIDIIMGRHGDDWGSFLYEESIKDFLLDPFFTDLLNMCVSIEEIKDNPYLWSWYYEQKEIKDEMEYWTSASRDNTHVNTIYEAHCPVNINIYSLDGSLLGTVSNGDDLAVLNDVTTWTNGETKYASIPWYSTGYKIELVGTDTGSMDFIVNSVNVTTGDNSIAKSYSNIKLEPDKLFEVDRIAEFPTNTELYVLDSDGKRIGTVHEDGTETYNDVPEEDVMVTAITVSGNNAITTKGGTAQLTAMVTPDNATNKAIAWSVISGGKHATLSNTGLVTATSSGTVTVRAMAKDGSAVSGEIIIAITGQETPAPVTYPVLANFGTWTGNGTATATVDGDFAKFVRLTLNGAAVDPANYTVASGSTVIALAADYLRTLANGAYVFCAEYSDGASDPINLTVNKPTSLRHSGTDRHDTAALASQTAFPDPSQVDTVIVTRSDNFPDALAASALAGSLKAPILLTTSQALRPKALSELDRLQPTTVYVLGGNDSVGDSVVTAITKLASQPNVVRLAGKGTTYRYGTAKEIAEAAIAKGASTSEFFLAKGSDFPDALAVSSFAASQKIPVLLSDAAPVLRLHSEVIDYINRYHPKTAFILGDENSLTTSVETELKNLGVTPVRLSGQNREETAKKIIETLLVRYAMTPRLFGIANNGVVNGAVNAQKFADALSGGAAIGVRGGILLLTPNNTLAPSVRDVLSKHAPYRPSVEVFGGADSISGDVEQQLKGVLGLP